MIRDLRILRGGCYGADFRFDEGIRIREDNIFPCLCSANSQNRLSAWTLLVEVIEINETEKFNDDGVR